MSIYIESMEETFTVEEFRALVETTIEDMYMGNGFNADIIHPMEVAETVEGKTALGITMPVNALLILQDEVREFKKKYGIEA